jgi:hypothetical protein
VISEDKFTLEHPLALTIVLGTVGHNLAQTGVEEAGAQSPFEDVVGADVAHHQGGDASTVARVKDAEHHLRSPVTQPFIAKIIPYQPGYTFAQADQGSSKPCLTIARSSGAVAKSTALPYHSRT